MPDPTPVNEVAQTSPEEEGRALAAKLKSWLRIPMNAGQSIDLKTKIQQEEGEKTIPVITKLIEDGQVDRSGTEQLVYLAEGITMPDSVAYPLFRMVCESDVTLNNPNFRPFMAVLHHMIATGASLPDDALSKDLDKLKKIASEIKDLDHRDQIEHAISASTSHLNESAPRYKMYLQSHRDLSQSIYRAGGYREYSRVQDSRTSHRPESQGKQVNEGAQLGLKKPEVSGDRAGVYYYNGKYLVATVGKDLQYDTTYRIDNKEVKILPHDCICEVDFMPFGNADFVPQNTLKSLVLGYYGLRGLINRVTTPERFPGEPHPPKFKYFVGTTNRRMGEMAERFGFKMQDEDRAEEAIKGDPYKTDTVTVVATLDDVVKAMQKFESQRRAGKIITRAMREH